jgi:nucleoside-diphosphate-sugar epimerase
MRIFVAGATGVLGRRAVKRLVEAGHDVTAVARSDAKAKGIERAGATPARVDIFDADAVRDAAAGHDVVMNLATHIPPASRSTLRSAWKQNDRIRSEGARNLVDAAIAAGAQRYVQESIAFTYPDRGSDLIDEDVPLELTATNVRSVASAEGEAARFAATGGAAVTLRFGMFYGPDASHTGMQLNAARRGVSTFLGAPGGYVSLIHLDDAAGAVVAALAAPTGVYNVVDDDPLTRAEVDEVLAAAVGRDRLWRPPVGLAKLGGSVIRLLMRSQRVSNARLRAATSWEPAHPTIRKGLAAMVGRA